MTEERLKQILQKVKADFSQLYHKHHENFLHDYRKYLNAVAELASFGIVVCSGRNDALLFIGPCRLCRYLGSQYGGKVSVRHRVWAWEGYIDRKKLNRILESSPYQHRCNRFIQIYPQDREEIWQALCKEHNRYILDSGTPEQSAYIGNWYTAHHLKRIYGGHHIKTHGLNCWYGPLTITELEKSVTALTP